MKKSNSKKLSFSKFKVAQLNFAKSVNGGTDYLTTTVTTTDDCTRECPSVGCTIDTDCPTDGDIQTSSFICTN